MVLEAETKVSDNYRVAAIAAAQLELLNKAELKKYIRHEFSDYVDGDRLIIFDEISSTNDYLLKCGGHICFAESQTAGRGRLGREWCSPYARNIYLSLLWRFPDFSSAQLSGLSLAVAVAVVEALGRYGIKVDEDAVDAGTLTMPRVGLKWPNDVLWQQRKLAGVLTEVAECADSVEHVEHAVPAGNCGACSPHGSAAVIGVGLNVNMPKQLGEGITQEWCDVAQILQAQQRVAPISSLQRNKLAGMLLDQLLAALRLYQEQGFAPFRLRWERLDVAYGKTVSIVTPQQCVIVGIDRGVNEQGFLKLELSDGAMQSFASGEVSLRLPFGG